MEGDQIELLLYLVLFCKKSGAYLQLFVVFLCFLPVYSEKYTKKHVKV